MMGMVVMLVTVGIATRFPATAGVFLRTMRVLLAAGVGMFAFAAATIPVRCGGRALRTELLPAVLAAKVKRLSLALGAESRCFVHRHSANRVFGHDFIFGLLWELDRTSNVFIHPSKRTRGDFITEYFPSEICHGFTGWCVWLNIRPVKHVEEPLLKNLQTFVAFARKRLGDSHLAEDVVQDSLVKALASSKKPAKEEDTAAWFYRILRRSIIDLYRRRDASKRALERFQQELPDLPTGSEERLLCQCFKRLLPSVPEQYREVLQRIDLDGSGLSEVASELGLTKNNLTVRLHRARKLLRDMVSRNCRACSKHGCLDCTCGAAVAMDH